ncbi:hypothetical protein [Actinomadura macra]|uniref:hypothetical protein n=1 Tax=Actinomadura macra TaxID=46164 RepID=UPI00082B029E|nr:hypothetical protein [Actinomadura macra]
MDDEALRQVQRELGGLIDPEICGQGALAAAQVDGEFGYDSDLEADELAEELAARFRAGPHLGRLMLVRDGVRVAVGTRERVLGAEDITAGGEFGAGDRAVLLGGSTRYRLLEFACGHASCGTEYRSFYDERFLPRCPTHGAMELRLAGAAP